MSVRLVFVYSVCLMYMAYSPAYSGFGYSQGYTLLPCLISPFHFVVRKLNRLAELISVPFIIETEHCEPRITREGPHKMIPWLSLDVRSVL